MGPVHQSPSRQGPAPLTWGTITGLSASLSCALERVQHKSEDNSTRSRNVQQSLSGRVSPQTTDIVQGSRLTARRVPEPLKCHCTAIKLLQGQLRLTTRPQHSWHGRRSENASWGMALGVRGSSSPVVRRKKCVCFACCWGVTRKPVEPSQAQDDEAQENLVDRHMSRLMACEAEVEDRSIYAQGWT